VILVLINAKPYLPQVVLFLRSFLTSFTARAPIGPGRT
jgi:hypothetical protein